MLFHARSGASPQSASPAAREPKPECPTQRRAPQRKEPQPLLRLIGVAGLLCAGLVTPLLPLTAGAADGGHAAVEARYQAERKACLEGRSTEDQATCLKEAGAVRAEALRHRLDNGEDRATMRANALARCNAQPASERAACEMMVRGQGTQSGSVREGAVIKELVLRSVDGGPAMPVEPSRPASPASAVERAAPASAPASSPTPTR